MTSIDHVIVLMLENRSFDHMLGFLPHPDPVFDGLAGGGGPFANPGWNGGPPVAATPHAKAVLPGDPDHSHDAVLEQLAVAGRTPTNSGFVASFERKALGLAPPVFGGLIGPLLNRWMRRKLAARRPAADRGPLVMLCQDPERVPVLATLALRFAVCTRWFCSVPGETWPNRNFLHAATSDGQVDIDPRWYTNRTIFEVLEEYGRTWHVYHDDTPQIWAFPKLWDTPGRHANWYPVRDFATHVATGRLPAYSFIEPNHRPPLHDLDHSVFGGPGVSNSQHPGNNGVAADRYAGWPADADTDFARGEALIAGVYEALRDNPDVFRRSLLVITYDEHGGFYDHVPPPTGVPAPLGGPGPIARLLHRIWHRRARAFDFTMLGPRVPAVVVSPLIPAGTVDRVVRDHASVPATLRALFAPDAAPLTARDAWARPFHGLASLAGPRTDLPDLSAYVRPDVDAFFVEEPSVDEPQTVPGHYTDFFEQAERVRARLAAMGEPELAGAPAAAEPRRAVQISREFAAAAERHRST